MDALEVNEKIKKLRGEKDTCEKCERQGGRRIETLGHVIWNMRHIKKKETDLKKKIK